MINKQFVNKQVLQALTDRANAYEVDKIRWIYDAELNYAYWANVKAFGTLPSNYLCAIIRKTASDRVDEYIKECNNV